MAVGSRRDLIKASVSLSLAAALVPIAWPALSQPIRLRWRGPENEVAKALSTPQTCQLWRVPDTTDPTVQAMAWIEQAETIVAGRIGDDPLVRARCAVEQAELLAQQHDLDGVRAAVANTLGNIEQLTPGPDALDAARAYFGQAVQLSNKSGDRVVLARALINTARLDLRRNEVGVAAGLLDLANTALEGSDLAFERIALASTYNDLVANDPSQLQSAFQAVTEARNSAATAADPRLQSWGEGLAGELYAQAGRHDEALSLLRQASRLAEQADAPEVAYRWQWHAGRILAADDELDAAIAAYEVARNNVDKVRLDLPEFDPQTGISLFRRTLGPIYTGLADLYLRQAARDGTGEAKPRPLINARQVVEQLKAAELEDFFGDACTAALLEQSVDLETTTTPGAAILYPILLDDRTELVVTLPDGSIKSARSDVGAAEVTKLCEALRDSLLPPALSNGDSGTSDFIEPARVLFGHLITPIKPFLEGVGTIVFVPDGPLRSIPLAALLDGDRFLAEDYAIGTTLGLQLLQSATTDRSQSRLLFAGIAEQIPNQEQFPPLVSVVLERDRIAEVLPPQQVLFDEGFKEDAIATQITERTFDIVHVATHGLFGARPEDSYILAWDEEVNMSDFETILLQTRFRDDPIDLLTLSACKTAEGNDRAALGIAGLAVKVGARSALASLWEAVDDSTAPMMADFYKYLIKDQQTKAIALQLAQVDLINSGENTFDFGREALGKTHPVYWASFIMVGSWT